MTELEKIEELSSQFYQWELRGRGWYVWDKVIDIEPPFVPFQRYISTDIEYIDEGRKHTIISRFLENLFNNKKQKESISDNVSEYIKTLESKEPNKFTCNEKVREIGIRLSNNHSYDYKSIEQLLISSAICMYSVSFEIIGSSDEIHIQFCCRESDYNQFVNVIKTYIPNVNVSDNDGLLNKLELTENNTTIIEFGLSEEFIRPIKAIQNNEVDPLINVLSVLNDLVSDEVVVFQILYKPVENPWADSIVSSVTNFDGSCFFIDDPDMLSLAKEKINKPLFSVVLRLAVSSKSDKQIQERLNQLFRCIELYKRPSSNELIPLTNEPYEQIELLSHLADNEKSHLQDLLKRESHRCGMILNSDELKGFVHFPINISNLSKLRKEIKKTRKAPNIALNNKFVLGVNIHNDKEYEVSLNHEQRFKHTYIVGATGTGKSTLLLSLINQDIKEGLGLCVVDPHGELIDNVLKHIPETRYDDVILFDPSDTDYPIGLNVLEAKTEIEKNVLSSDLVSIFKSFSSSWGDQMTTVLGNAISAILENSNGGSLLDLRKFLVDREFRNEFLNNVDDELIKNFWKHEFPLLKGGTISSLLTRLDNFLRPKIIRNIISQRKGLNLDYVLNNNKILLVKLAQGLIGEDNAYLLGSLLVSKLQQVLMKRQEIQKSERRPFFLYLDEFQHFISPSMSAILSGARKYSLGLILAHQELRQLWDKDTSLSNSVLSNPYTRICFRLGDFDAQKLSSGFHNFNATNLQNLSTGEAIVRIEKAEYDFNLRTHLPKKVEDETANKNKEAIIDLSRKKYSNTNINYDVLSKEKPIVTEPISKKEIIDTPSKAHEIPKKIEIPKVISKSVETENVSYHRYLQTLIKKMAEQRGYKAIIEEPTKDGKGRVDVGLSKGKERVACEVSVSTNKEQELRNIKKCFDNGYDKVIVCSNDKKHLRAIKKFVEQELDNSKHERVFYFQPEELFGYLENQVEDKKKVNEKVVKGYRVKVSYNDISEDERIQKEKVVAGVMLKAIRRLKKE